MTLSQIKDEVKSSDFSKKYFVLIGEGYLNRFLIIATRRFSMPLTIERYIFSPRAHFFKYDCTLDENSAEFNFINTTDKIIPYNIARFGNLPDFLRIIYRDNDTFSKVEFELLNSSNLFHEIKEDIMSSQCKA